MAIVTRTFSSGYVFEDDERGIELDIEGGPRSLSITLTGPEYRDYYNYPTCDSLDISLGISEVKDLVLNLTTWVEGQERTTRKDQKA